MPRKLARWAARIFGFYFLIFLIVFYPHFLLDEVLLIKRSGRSEFKRGDSGVMAVPREDGVGEM